MNFSSPIDLTIILSFLITTVVLGLIKNHSSKDIKDYALGGQNFSTGAIVATLVATWIGGGTFATSLSKTYSDGLFYIIASTGQVISFLLMGLIFVPRMSFFLGKLSIAEAMGEKYGNYVRIIIAITGIFGSIGFIAIQFKVFGSLVAYFLDFSPLTGIIIASVIVTGYSAVGGIKAVTFTDVLQMMTFGFAIPIIGVMIWNHAYNDGFTLSTALKIEKFNPSIFFVNQTTDSYFALFSLMAYYAVPGMTPAVIQRVSMGSSLSQVKRAFLIAALIVLFIKLTMQWVPFLIYSTNPNLDFYNLFGYIIDHYTYVGLKGLMITGVIAMAMSTADSYINSSSILFSHDICSVIGIGKRRELFISKLFAFGIGSAGIIIASSSKDLLDIVMTTNAFYIPVVTIPVILTILGFKTNKKSILYGMGAGFLSITLWKFLKINADGILVAMFINLMAIFVTHLLSGMKFNWTDNLDDEFKKTKKNKQSIYSKIYNGISEFSYFEYCLRKSPNNELSYIGFGAYIIVYTITSMYSVPFDHNTVDHSVVLTIYQFMMISGVALVTFPIWPDSLDRIKIAKLLWPILIFIIMVAFNTFLVIISDVNTLQFATFTTNLITTVVLLGWRTGIPLISFGIISMIGFYSCCTQLKEFQGNIDSPAFIIIYVCLIVGTTIMIFIKPREDEREGLSSKVGTLNNRINHYHQKMADQEREIKRLGATTQKILNNVNHELRLPVGNVMNFSEMLKNGLNEYSPEEQKILTSEVYNNSKRLSSMILNMLDLIILDTNKMNLNKKKINFSELVEDRITHCCNIYLEEKPLNFEVAISQDIFLDIDPNYMRQVIDNLVINAINHTDYGTIKINLKQKETEVCFTIQDQGKGIYKEDLYDIFTPFKIGKNTESKAEGRGIGLALCKTVIQAHNGQIKAQSNGTKGAKFTFTMPIELQTL